MSSLRTRQTGELAGLLDEQVRFMELSAASFDSGFDGEAKRLAVTVRVLVHDTTKSVSLLGQMRRKTIQFFGSSFPFDPRNRMSHGGLVFMALAAGGARFVAMLDDIPPNLAKWISFDRWWSMPIFVDKDRRVLSRKDVILAAANQDGGAHVDPVLNDAYAALSRDHSLGWISTDGKDTRPIEGAEKAAIRQIAHELIKTLKPNYEKKPNHDALVIVGGMSTVQEARSTAAELPATAIVHSAKVGRNAPCPCGSGVKFKKCHGNLGI